jgi:hypothetical protein
VGTPFPVSNPGVVLEICANVDDSYVQSDHWDSLRTLVWHNK